MTWPGRAADIGPAMPANFRFIANPAQRNPHKLAARRTGPDGHRQRSLADPWRPDEAQNGPLRIFSKLADGQKFQDSFLDLVQTIVLFVQYLLRGLDSADFLRFFLHGTASSQSR